MIKFMRIDQDDHGGPYAYVGAGKSIIRIDFTERKRPVISFQEEEFPSDAVDMNKADVNGILQELTRSAVTWDAEKAELKDGVINKGKNSEKSTGKKEILNDDKLPGFDLEPEPLSQIAKGG